LPLLLPLWDVLLLLLLLRLLLPLQELPRQLSLRTLTPLLLVWLLLLLLLQWLLPRRQLRLGSNHDLLVPLAVLDLVLPPLGWDEIMKLSQPLQVGLQDSKTQPTYSTWGSLNKNIT